MSDFTSPGSTPVTVWTGSRYGLNVGTREMAAGGANFASTAWGTANLAIYTPLWLPFAYPVKNFFVMKGATVAGNLDIGIYDEQFALLASAGTTAMAATASIMQFVAKDILLAPGQYYLGFTSSSTTAAFWAMAWGTATRERYMGVMEQGTALPLPASATPIAVAHAQIPVAGITRLSAPVF